MIRYILEVLDEENPVKKRKKRLARVTSKCQGSARPNDQAVDGEMALVLRIREGHGKSNSHVPIGFGGELSAHSQRRESPRRCRMKVLTRRYARYQLQCWNSEETEDPSKSQGQPRGLAWRCAYLSWSSGSWFLNRM